MAVMLVKNATLHVQIFTKLIMIDSAQCRDSTWPMSLLLNRQGRAVT